MSTRSDLIDFVVNQVNGVKGLADLNPESIPNHYIQPQEERFNDSKIVSDEYIPTIDFAHWDDPDVEESIFNAATMLGFFQIINHRIPIKLIEDLKAAVYGFFELKKRFLKENTAAEFVKLADGYVSHAEATLEWKDSLWLFYASEEKAKKYWPAICMQGRVLARV